MNDTAVIDLELGKSLINGDESDAKDMLKTLSQLLPEHQRIIDKAYRDGDFIVVANEVHKLHGGACYCGTPRLKQASKKLEQAIKLNHHGEVATLYKNLMTEIKAVQDAFLTM